MLNLDRTIHKLNEFAYQTLVHINPELSTRGSTASVKSKFGDEPLNCIEIGVSYGNNAFNLLSVLNINKLFLVDPYIITDAFPQGAQTDWTLNDEPDVVYEKCKKRLKPFVEKTVFIRKPSAEANKHIIAHNLKIHYIYVDGNHSYESVKEDLALYYPLLADGGVMGGDDFSGSFFGVCRAVLEFVDEHDLVLFGDKKDWWFVKDESSGT